MVARGYPELRIGKPKTSPKPKMYEICMSEKPKLSDIETFVCCRAVVVKQSRASILGNFKSRPGRSTVQNPLSQVDILGHVLQSEHSKVWELSPRVWQNGSQK